MVEVVCRVQHRHIAYLAVEAGLRARGSGELRRVGARPKIEELVAAREQLLGLCRRLLLLVYKGIASAACQTTRSAYRHRARQARDQRRASSTLPDPMSFETLYRTSSQCEKHGKEARASVRLSTIHTRRATWLSAVRFTGRLDTMLPQQCGTTALLQHCAWSVVH